MANRARAITPDARRAITPRDNGLSRACDCARLLVGVMAKWQGWNRLPQQRGRGGRDRGVACGTKTLIHDDDQPVSATRNRPGAPMNCTYCQVRQNAVQEFEESD